jgi:hypothetical protein
VTKRKSRSHPRPLPRLRKGAPDAEALRWVRAHDVFDRIDAGIAEVVDDHTDLDLLLEDALAEENTTQLNMRVPAALKAVLGRLARERTTDVTTLARIWLAERVREELRKR